MRDGQTEEVPRIGVAELKADPQLVAILERLLALAKDGTLGGMAYVGYQSNQDITYGFVGPEMRRNMLRTHGLLHWLASRAMRIWEQGAASEYDTLET